MPTQIQTSIDDIAVREPIIQVPADGDVVTSSGLADTAIALGRRIEFERARINALTEDPFPQAQIVDDFTQIHNPGGTSGYIISDSGIWKVVGSDQGSITQGTPGSGVTPADPEHPTMLRFGSSAPKTLLKAANSLALGRLIKAVCHVWIESTHTGFEWGLKRNSNNTFNETSIDALSLQYDSTQHTNWIFRSGNSGGNTRTDSGIAVAFDDWNRLELTYDGTDLLFSANGSVPTAALTNLPVLTTPLTAFFMVLGSFAEINVDGVSFKFDTAERVP